MTGKRERTKASILQAAVDIFIDNGLEKTNIGDIAKKVGIDRRTIYRHYASKELLALDVEYQIFQKLFGMLEKFSTSLTGNGYEKLTNIFDNFIAIIENHRKEVKFTGEFDRYFTGGYPDKNFSSHLKILLHKVEVIVVSIIEEGFADGSIKNILTAPMIYHVLSNGYISFIQRIFIREELIRKEQNVAPDEVLLSFHMLMLSSLKK